jgi:hypothetical protein
VDFRDPIAQWRLQRYLGELSPQLARVESYLGAQQPADDRGGGVLFFNASTRIHRVSLNAAFSLLASWTLRAAGTRTHYLVCRSELAPCILGTRRQSPRKPPPCGLCRGLSGGLFPSSMESSLGSDVSFVTRTRDELVRLPVSELMVWQHEGLPFGEWVLPSVRWVMRRHHLQDSATTRWIFAGYLASGVGFARALALRLERAAPSALVVFNGIFYPEAVAREVALRMGIPVVTHEVGLKPLSAYFSHEHATFREIGAQDATDLTRAQEEELDEVLARRSRGDFTMAGVRFWPRMEGLPRELQQKRGQFPSMVSVFANVIFDTSQVHANTVFRDMFEWLDAVAKAAVREPGILFVLRAHPDELRRGKESEETLQQWYQSSAAFSLPNVIFIGPREAVSSYELVRESRLVLVYSSSIGIEASALGAAVLVAGRARYSGVPVAYSPSSRGEYEQCLQDLLGLSPLEPPADFQTNARAFLYREWSSASLDLSEFLVPDRRSPGMVRFREFDPERLRKSEALSVIRRGILEGSPFLMVGSRAS